MFMLFGLGWLALPLLLWALYALVTEQSKLGGAVLALFTTDYFLPAGKKWPAFVHSRVWDCWRRYFSYQGTVPAFQKGRSAFRGRHAVFVHLPHAVFPMGILLAAPTCDDPLTGMPSPSTALVATVLLKLPIVKHILAWNGCLPADKAIVMERLKYELVGLIVEGVAGIFHGATPQHERVYLRRRKGFVKCAIQAGCDLVPVYHMGNSQLLTFSGNSAISRRWRMSIGVFWGRWGLPLPRRHRVLTLVGEPVPVEQCDEPSMEAIDALHARFITATRALFDQHKHLVPGWEHKQLLVV